MNLAERFKPVLQESYTAAMAAIVGGIIGEDMGSYDNHGNPITSLSITGDGFVLSNNGFISSVQILERNLELLIQDAKLTPDEIAHFDSLFRRNVTDWRTIAKGTCANGRCPEWRPL